MQPQHSKPPRDDFTLNPHLLGASGVKTALPVLFTNTQNDCTGAVVIGNDTFQGRNGIFLAAPRIPVGQFHRFQVVTDTNPRRAAFNFTSEAVSLIGCISPPNYPERPFNQGSVDRVFVFAGSSQNNPACFGGPDFRPIRACPTSYGWHIEVDSGGTGNFDMIISFIFG